MNYGRKENIPFTAQQLEFISVSESITDDELEFYYTLTAEDIQIINTHRGQENRLGFAMTLCCLRHKGWPYPVLDSVPLKVLNYVSAQIDVDSVAIQGYGRNKNTKSNHLLEICSYYGYRQEDAWNEVADFIRCCSHRLNDIVAIIKEAVQFSKENRIIPPKLTTISRMVHDAIGKEEERVFASVSGKPFARTEKET